MGQRLYVLFDGKQPSEAALTRCFKQLGFPLAFERCQSSVPGLAMRLRGEETGVDFYDISDLRRFKSKAGFEARFARGVALHWVADRLSSTIASCLATAFAKLTNGAIFSSEEDGVVPLETALAWARRDLESTRQKVVRPTTRQRDIRRYLKSLLKQRSDLALVGRFLFIRPVRHVLRCAHFAPTRDRYAFHILRQCTPLFSYAGETRDEVEHLRFKVWQPHFEPMLIDSLARDVFEEVGKVTTLSDLAGMQSNLFATSPRITSLLLAGEQERAMAAVEEIELTDPMEGGAKHPAREHWERVSKDIDATCAECHAIETHTVKALGLEPFWEPSPFAVELPSADRVRVSEPLFTTTPWPARPPWLWQDMPQWPREIRYAKDFVGRGGLQLLVALTREEAEERHHALESYVMATRLPDGLLVLISRFTFWDRHHPQDLDPVEREEPKIHIYLDGCLHSANGSVSPDKDNPDLARFESFGASPSGKIFDCRLDFKRRTKMLRDERTGKAAYTKLALTAAERKLATVPKPGFGEYQLVVERLRALLRLAGCGEIV